MADYAIHDTTLEAIADTIRKKDGTQALIDPADYADRINLMGMLPEKTQASASVCSFEDGADDVPSSSVKVTIPPTLSGVSSVSETQTGRNLLPNEKYQGASTRVNIGQADDGYSLHLKAGTYTLSATSLVQMSAYYRTSTGGSNVLIWSTYGTSGSGTFTLSEDSYVRIWLYNGDDGLSVSDVQTFQLEYGSTAHAYEPYQTPTTYTASLGRTIYGGTADVVNGTGKEQYQKVKVSDLTWQKQTASGRDFFIATINDQETTNTHDVAIDITGLTYAGMVTVAGMSDKSLAKWLQSVRIYDTSVSTVSDLLSTYGNGEIVFYLKDTEQTDFTFTGQEINTRLGYNAFWADSGDTEVTYRSSGTITPVPIVPTLITKTITENGTYDAEDDDADGYSSVEVNVSSLPTGDHDDPLGIMTDYSRCNIQNLYSAYCIENGALKKEVVFQLLSGSGYEGFCISMDNLGLVSGTTYNITFVLDVPAGVSFSGSYPWGVKYSSARIPASGAAGTNTFNISPDVDFLQQTGTQNVTMQFTASASNYLVILLSRLSGNLTQWIKMRNIDIEEVTT